MTSFRDEQHLYGVLDAFFTRVRDVPDLSEALVAGRFVLRFRYTDPTAEVTVDLRQQPITWHLGPCDLRPDLEMIQSADTAHRFWLGVLSVPRALATRQVVSRGNVAKALKLLPALKPAFVVYEQVLRDLGEEALLEVGGAPQVRDKGEGRPVGRAEGLLGLFSRFSPRSQAPTGPLAWMLSEVERLAGRALGKVGGSGSAAIFPAAPVHVHRPLIPLFDGPSPSPPAFRQPDLPEGTAALEREMLSRMWLIRAFEERISESNALGEIPTEAIHLSIGQEATAVGVCFALRGDDYLATTHRGHGHMLAKGADLGGMMAELLGKATGLCGGKGGSMHVTEAAVGAIGANGIVGASPLMAAGAAHAAQLRGSDQVAVAFLGDGATNQGMFHEGLNFAAVLDLPVVFVVENNLYGEFTPLHRHCRVTRLADRAAAYGIPGIRVDGNDVAAVLEAAREAVARARSGRGPTLLECLTYRWHGHMEGEDVPYRPAEEIAQWRERCPIVAWRRRLISEGTLTPPEAEEVEQEARAAVWQAWEAALAAPEPGPEALYLDVYAPEPRSLYSSMSPMESGWSHRPHMQEQERSITGSEAIREALAEELERDATVYLLGEDVSTGGYFAVTAGLVEHFGAGRIVDTPISEYAIVGSAVGAALVGARPVAEILFSDFLTTCMDPLVNQAAKLRYMSGGQVTVPLVVRTPGGGGLGMAAQHSQSLEALLTGIPGLIVLAPGTPADAKGLLKTAIRSNNPVLFFENKLLYPTTGPLPVLPPGAEHLVPIGKAEVKRFGRDVTLVSVGAILGRAMEAAEAVAAEGVEVEVVDLRSLVPLDLDTVLDSVRRTGRLVTVEDGCLCHGFGSEILARVAEAAFGALRAAPRRVAGADVPLPYNVALENLALPDPERIAAALREVHRR